ncbi:MAG: glycosyltransferase family 2 protein [Burkholderiales bacterium]|nr:glycosyltransferase family 2 protein [Burkholderiales bacterium]MDE2395195.1 glycosyltransferase family 2 protein [Burkholderiales bacterium]MDE2453855.1 glycosyltransferase family 2 protein [Burkholderiales bacterium]
MNALAIAMVKNEADLIEAFVRHHLAFVDLMVVIDNASSDGTREILIALQREGLPVLVFDDPIFGYFQSEKLTHVYRKVVPVFQPDIVYLLDADEFLHAPGREALEQALSGIAPGSMALVPWRTQVPTPGASAHAPRLLADPLGSLPGRRRQEEPTYYKAVIRRDPAQDACLVIEQGNHSVHLEGGAAVPAARLDGVSLVHLPVRSVDQLSAKVINGWHAYLVKNRHRAEATAGFQWQLLYDRIVHGEGISEEALCQTALDYAQSSRAGRNPVDDVVHDPVPGRYGALKYLHLARSGALAKVALSMEAYLRQEGRAPAPPQVATRAQDLAPIAELVRQLGLGSVGAVGEGLEWLPGLLELLPGLRPARGAAAELLLLPTDSLQTFGRLAAQAADLATRAIVHWTPARDPQAMRQALQDWYDAGWEPQLMQTMASRALASYAAQRGSVLVLQPLDPARHERAALVRELLASLAAAPAAWRDPAAQHIRHPMQDLQIGAAV